MAYRSRYPHDKKYNDDHLFRSGSNRYGSGLPMSWKAVLVVIVVAVIVYGMTACGNKDSTPAPPTDTIDRYTGKTFSRFGFKSPVNGKDVYYYLTFKKNFQIDNYIKYNKTESSTDNSETGIYEYTTTNPSAAPNTTSFLMTFKAGKVLVDQTDNRLILHNSSGDIVYTLE